MLKLASINIETDKHFARVESFLSDEQPDFICLQEAPAKAETLLRSLGFTHVSFLPMLSKELSHQTETVGVMTGSKYPTNSQHFIYHGDKINNLNSKSDRSDIVSGYIFCEIMHEDGIFKIATTHLTDTEDGLADDFQTELFTKFINSISKQSPHCLCGDMNMPRGFNELYEVVTKYYKDNIPKHYQSSLDRNIHRLGNQVLDQPIFDKYMVDYIFSQAPYLVTDVRLEFGISDHAAVIGHLTIEK